MKVKKHFIRKLKNAQVVMPLLIVGVLVATGAVIYNFNAHAASGGFSFESSVSSLKVGDTVNVSVYEDSSTDCANVVQVDFTYPSSQLRYNSFSANDSKFDAPAPSKNSDGKVSIVQFTTRKECGSGATATSGVSGRQLIGVVSFTAVGTGSASLNFQNSSIAVSAADNKSDVAPGTTNKSFTIASAGGTNPTPTPTPTSPAPSSPRPVSRPSLSVTKPGTDESLSLKDNDSVQVTEPVDLSPLPVQPDGVSKVEYYLDSKLMATVKTAPYTYHLETSEILNGTYTLTTKTYYENGQTKSASQKIIVKNAFSFTQFRLLVKKFAWLIILILLVIGALVVAWFIHRRGGTNSPNYYGDKTLDNTSDYMVTSSNAAGRLSDDMTAGGSQVYHPSGSTTNKV